MTYTTSIPKNLKARKWDFVKLPRCNLNLCMYSTRRRLRPASLECLVDRGVQDLSMFFKVNASADGFPRGLQARGSGVKQKSTFRRRMQAEQRQGFTQDLRQLKKS